MASLTSRAPSASSSSSSTPPSHGKSSARRSIALCTASVFLFAGFVSVALRPHRKPAVTDGLEIARRLLIPARRWESTPPRWCAQLIAEPMERPRTSSVYDCRRGRFGAVCEDGKPRFFSQYNQDLWTWTQHWKYLRRKGVYVDIAANEPVRISNTYFYDRCLHWRGLCVEAHPTYVPLLERLRSCAVMPTCVSSKAENVSFALDGGSSGVDATNKNHVNGNRSLALRCVATAAALRVARTQHIDMLSLDVEGHEHLVLEGIDWRNALINVIVMETLNDRSKAVLIGKGYRRARTPTTPEEKKVPGALFSDHVFIHPSVKWGRPV